LKTKKILSYTRIKDLTIASGPTPNWSTGREPDEDGNIRFNAGVKIDIIIGGKNQIINSMFHSHREGFTTKVEKNNPVISGIEIAKQGSR
jgi:hypothetical protein